MLALGLDAADERAVFVAELERAGGACETVWVGNAVKGARYQVYRAASLTEKFEPWGEIVTAVADGVLDFAVATEGAPSGFFKIVPAR